MDNLTQGEDFKISITFNYDTGILFSFFITIMTIIFSLSMFYYIHKSLTTLKNCLNYIINNPFIFVIFVYVGIIVQELIKSMILKLFAGVKFREQKAGFNINSLMPYIKSRYPVSIKSYMLLLVVPNILIIVVLIISIFINNSLIIILSFVWLFFSGYDILTLIKLKKFVNTRYLVNESDNLPGVYLYENPF